MDDGAKIKHSKRMHQKENHIKKQVKIAKEHTVSEDNPREVEHHRFHKRHAMNCGNPDCFMCGNPRKFVKELTIQEKSFEQTLNWQQE